VQATSGTLAAAIDAKEREPVVRLRVDWDRDGSYTDADSDLSADVVNVRLSRELETDLPEQARLFAGSAAATATVILKHRDPTLDPDKHTAWYYSPLNTASPLYGVKRKGAPVILDVGFVGDAGPEYVTELVGTVRSLVVNRGGRTATMVLADPSVTMRKQVQLPMIIADGETSGGNIIRPNLNCTFLADWIARKCGYYASPPARASARVVATHHGSGYPEIGGIQHHHGAFGSKLSYSPTPVFPTAAKFVQAVNTDGSSGQEITYVMSGGTLSVNNSGEVLWEGWRKFNTAAVDQPLFIAYNTGQATPFVSMFYQPSTGRLVTTFNRGGADTNHTSGTSGPSVSPGTSWHYYAVQMGFTSTGVDITIRYDTTTTGPFTIATGSFTGSAVLNTLGVARGKISAFSDGFMDGLSEADQITAESTTSVWNNTFVPTADIRPSAAIDNRLVATPNVSEQGWQLLQMVAAAEFATTGFSETGQLFYWPRDRWTRSPYTTSQSTLTPAANLQDLETTEAMDQVYNRVIIRVLVPVVEDSQTVWKLGSRWKIPANGTITKLVELNDPVANVDTSVVYGTTAGSSRYLAGTQLDGQGAQVSNLTITVTVLGPTTLRIQIDNPNAFVVYMAGDENASVTYAGKPYLWIDAQAVTFSQEPGNNSRERAEAVDAGSIAAYNIEQVLQVPDSDFRQDSDDVQTIADDLVGDLADPKPAISGVPIKGDPRLQLADRHTINDTGPEGLGFLADFHLSKVEMVVDPGEGMTMTVSLRGA
jgi:hypothetical protein